jgi:L-alanine-DL-glutamate epimerase-like enolase superfamily enzyme
LPALKAAPRRKITDVRVFNLKVVKETGTMEPAWSPGRTSTYRIGGQTILELHTDQGVSGIGPALNGASVEQMKALLVGKDPFDTEELGRHLRASDLGRATPRLLSSIEIALWDLAGKLTGQPLYKLWGADKDRVPAYASMIQLSTPEERARMALQVKAVGWKAIKLRLHYETMVEDIRLIETVRKAVGDDFVIMTDANQAQSAGNTQPGVNWSFDRALETARELEKFQVYWLEEPLKRYDLDGQAKLNQLTQIAIAGGENNHGVAEYRTMIERRTYDVLQPDVMVADGVMGFRTIAEMALAFDKRVVPHHGGGNLGTITQLHAIATWPHSDWIEILHDPPVSPYTNGFGIFENPPVVDKEGYINLPQGPGLGVTIDKKLIVAG